MKITRTVNDNNISLKLTFTLDPKELRLAYEEQQHIYDVSDIEYELDSSSEYYLEKYGVKTSTIRKKEIEQMAYLLRKKLNYDADSCWSQCKTEAVCEILEKRLQP